MTRSANARIPGSVHRPSQHGPSAIIDYLAGTEPLASRVEALIASRELIASVVARYEVLDRWNEKANLQIGFIDIADSPYAGDK